MDDLLPFKEDNHIKKKQINNPQGNIFKNQILAN